MTQRVIPEWSGEDLVYVEPTQVVKSFGYTGQAIQRVRKPGSAAMGQDTLDMVEEADGPLAEERVDYPDLETATAAIKQMAMDLDARLVGVTEVDQRHVFKGMDVPHKYVIISGCEMDYNVLKYTPEDQWDPENPEEVGAIHSSNSEIGRLYNKVGHIATDLAKFIRSRGYPARAHTLRFEEINMLPHARAAGLGELGKHGSLINLTLGSVMRVSAVTTDLPLLLDSPKDEGLEAICLNCKICVDYCPGDAISHEKQDVRGVSKWVVDTEACAPYWGSYSACGICLQVCPVNARASGGILKTSFIETLKSIDLPSWRQELQDGVQEQWSVVEKPTEFPEGWRMNVKGTGAAAQLHQGIPVAGKTFGDVQTDAPKTTS